MEDPLEIVTDELLGKKTRGAPMLKAANIGNAPGSPVAEPHFRVVATLVAGAMDAV
jgi:hypothetical protein